jgi:hypothetical protein
MAQLGTSNIKLSDINSLKSPATPVSLSSREKSYMGPGGTWAPATGVCMPEDVVTLTNPANNTGVLAQSINGSWVYSGGGYTASTPWGPHAMKEFIRAYNGIPRIVAASTSARGSTGSCNLSITIGGEFAKNGANYFYKLDGSAWNSWPVNGATWNSVQSTGLGGDNPPAGSKTFSFQLKDLYNCGADQSISTNIPYP